MRSAVARCWSLFLLSCFTSSACATSKLRGGTRRSLSEAGWFGPSEFGKHFDITTPDNAVHRTALKELKEKYKMQFDIEDMKRVPRDVLEVMHAVLDKKRLEMRGGDRQALVPHSTVDSDAVGRPRKFMPLFTAVYVCL